VDHDVFGMMIAERDRKIANLEFKLYSNPALLAPAPGVDLCDDGEDLVEVFEDGEDLLEFIERTAAENAKDFAAAKERWEAKYRGASLTPVKSWEDLDVMEKLKLMGQERDRREKAEATSPPHAVAATQAQKTIVVQTQRLWTVATQLVNMTTEGLRMSQIEELDKLRSTIMNVCAELRGVANDLDAG
jgi:hypothetical protein